MELGHGGEEGAGGAWVEEEGGVRDGAVVVEDGDADDGRAGICVPFRMDLGVLAGEVVSGLKPSDGLVERSPVG